jgi:isochorismate synthase
VSLRLTSRRLDAVELLDVAAAHRGEATYFCREGGPQPIEMLALGSCAVLEAHGPARFEDVARSARAVFGSVRWTGAAPAAAAPRLVGGFSFREEALSWDGFAAGRWILPQILIVRHGEETWMTSAEGSELPRAVPAAGQPLPHLRPAGGESASSFEARVRQALVAIRAGELSKVVLARASELRAEEPVPPFALAAALRRSQRGCLIYALRTASGAAFVGATPELLVRRRGAGVESCALAGSAPRGAGSLHASSKDTHEHELVVTSVRAALEPVAALRPAGPPQILELPHLEHLLTSIAGELTTDLSAIELAGRLHPTPAVAGTPRGAALEWLAKHEPLDRGWYAGAVGWQTADGDGELSVALRCARVEGCEVSLYAGGGIVERSEPEAEWAETDLKLRAVLSCFPE